MSGERTIEVELPGGRVAFSTRNGGVSDGPYESLNLGILTDDDRARVVRNRDLLNGDLGLEHVAMGHQVHGTRPWSASTAMRPRCAGWGCSCWWRTACPWR
jgi:copper oxidase (laccase) domain-containing protein